MILEKQKEAIVLSDGENTEESIGMSLDLDSAQVLMQMLSKNLYSDAVGSTVRECASNALDSHRRAGVDKPIIVTFETNQEGNYEFSVEDFGIGLDGDDVKNIISKYGKSTKRNSANELGMMGLGFKAPLAYTSSFYFVCRKNGVERKYMMYEGEDVNTIDLLYEKPTTEENGVKVIVPVKYGDRYEFMSKIKQQLAYFENVYFNCSNVENNFLIHRGEHFQFSELASDGYLHLCLDNVYYPLDFQKLGISRISFPVALRFSLTDGIFPTPNRESIRYTTEAKQIILEKIGKLADFYVDKYNETISDTMDIHQAFDYYNSSSKYVKGFKDAMLNVEELAAYSTKSIKALSVKGLKHLSVKRLYDVKYYILKEYECKVKIMSNRWTQVTSSYDKDVEVKDFDKKSSYCTEMFIHSEKIPSIKKDYIKSLLAGKRGKVIKKKMKSYPLGFSFKNGGDRSGNYDNYYTLLNLKNYHRSLWREVIAEFQSVVEMIISNAVNIDTLEVPSEFIESKKKKTPVFTTYTGKSTTRRVKLKGEIVGKMGERLERYVSGKNCKWVSNTWDMSKIHQIKSLVVYGGQEDVDMMDKLFAAVDRPNLKTKIKVVQFSSRELKIVNGLKIHNWMSINEFMEGKNKPFKRLVTAYLIDKLIDAHPNVFRRRVLLSCISTSLSEHLNTLYSYWREHYADGNDEMYKAMLEVAEVNNLFDTEMYVIYKEVKDVLEKLYFVESICDKFYSDGVDANSPMFKALIDLFKYYRHRINWENYNIKPNEESNLSTEEINNEQLEQLVD